MSGAAAPGAVIALRARAASEPACNSPGSKSRDGGAVVDLRQDTPVTSGGGGGGAGGSGAGGGNVLGADNGASCANAAACKSGFCVEGVCCNAACTGACLSCTN